MRCSHFALVLLLVLLAPARAQTPDAPPSFGAGWAALGGGLPGEGVRAFAVGPDGCLFVGGAFYRYDVGFARLAGWDGVAWNGIGPFDPEDPYGTFYDLSFGLDGRLVVAGGIDRLGGKWVSSLAVWDGVAWASVGGGVHHEESDGIYAAEVYALERDGARVLYAGGDFNRVGPVGASLPAGAVAAWDGQAWSVVGKAGLARADGGRAEVRALVVGPDGRLYAGGEFTTADGQPVANVAAWDGTAWDDLGGGLPNDGGIYTLAVGPDGRLYAGGGIGVVAGVETDIAAWDGTAWASVGPELQTPEVGGARALAFSADGKFYVGGFFTLPDGSRNVARLDNYAGPGAAVWVGLDGGVTHPSGEGIVRALAVGPEGEVFVGGLFDRVWEAPGGPSVEASNVAVWLGDRVVGGEAPVEARALALSVSPNPSREASTVSVTLASPSPVRVVVSDVLGRTVAVVHDGPLSAGTHALAADVSRLPAGVYAVRVVAGEASSSARLTVVR